MVKRNQVKDALVRVIQPGATALSSQTAGRMKRLLDLDRARGRSRRSRDPERSNFAFSGGEGPGRGHDVDISAYEAFALLVALQLTEHGWPPRSVVGLLRRLRPELERHHARILTEDPSVLFNQAKILAEAKPGQPDVGNTDPTFLVIVTESGSMQATSVCRGLREQFELYHRYGPGFTFTSVELANSAHALAFALHQTTPRRRGRVRG